MEEKKLDALKLENQLCFPLYAASKEIIRRYTPILEAFDLTYTQYITLMVLWQQDQITVKSLGEYLYLDSGTMTPVLKKLEAKGFITRRRARQDERSVVITLTEKGRDMKELLQDVPKKVGGCVHLEKDEAATLHRLLHKILTSLNKAK